MTDPTLFLVSGAAFLAIYLGLGIFGASGYLKFYVQDFTAFMYEEHSAAATSLEAHGVSPAGLAYVTTAVLWPLFAYGRLRAWWWRRQGLKKMAELRAAIQSSGLSEEEQQRLLVINDQMEEALRTPRE